MVQSRDLLRWERGDQSIDCLRWGKIVASHRYREHRNIGLFQFILNGVVGSYKIQLARSGEVGPVAHHYARLAAHEAESVAGPEPISIRHNHDQVGGK
ncbi:hypothetical protein GCM10011591_39480 [Nocardia camponoti]|uniref:Uncharacterized protein n=1 Tax=Nocardia camponoti TaxID=1616106 RepID=A0A917QR93_9NOCA|nr:hypothetical protein GCM10011591_39480 [Nocardia camponoti]